MWGQTGPDVLHLTNADFFGKELRNKQLLNFEFNYPTAMTRRPCLVWCCWDGSGPKERAEVLYLRPEAMPASIRAENSHSHEFARLAFLIIQEPKCEVPSQCCCQKTGEFHTFRPGSPRRSQLGVAPRGTRPFPVWQCRPALPAGTSAESPTLALALGVNSLSADTQQSQTGRECMVSVCP